MAKWSKEGQRESLEQTQLMMEQWYVTYNSKCSRNTHCIFVHFKVPVLEPSFSGPSVVFSKSSKTHIGEHPLVPDPYESRHVVCRQSQVPGSGDGLFARRDLPEGTIAAFYNGVRIPYGLGSGKVETWDDSAYKIWINADYESGERMNIPEDCVSLERYCATLGKLILDQSFRLEKAMCICTIQATK